jgi:protein-disulfide isomerase
MTQKTSFTYIVQKAKKTLVKIPKPKTYTPYLVFLLLIAVFLLGMLYSKLQYLQQNTAVYPTTGGTQQAQGSPAAAGQALHIAKSIGINPDTFKSCLTSKKYSKQVSDDLALGQKAGVTGTPSVFINGNMIVGAQPYAVFKNAIDQAIANPSAPIPSATPTNVDVSHSLFPFEGNANAPVTIVEFADFQCPFCQQFYQQTESQIINDYVKTGKAKFLFQNYPFLGSDSNTLSEAAYCANDQGKFWDFHNFVYQHQGQENSGWGNVNNLL